MFIFPLVFLFSFVLSVKEILSGNKAGFFLFLLFGLSIYTTAMSVTFLLGLKDIIHIFQFFKELLVLTLLTISIITLKTRPRFHLIDYLILSFLLLTITYAILPIGGQPLVQRLMALKSMSFYIVVYFAGRLIDIRTVFINKYFSYMLVLTILAGVVVSIEVIFNRNLQTITGYANYVYNIFNFEPSGDDGLSVTFTPYGGYRRFASFFDNPLEHAAATLLALSITIALFTNDNDTFKPNKIGWAALAASLLSIIFAFSRSPLISYFFIIYVYSLLTQKRFITKTVHYVLIAGACYVLYLFTGFNNHRSVLAEIIAGTIDFSNPSSVGHIVQWVEGALAIIAHPFGLGMGSSGRVAGSIGENVGGENQFIIIGVQAGVISMLLYLTIYIMFVRYGIKWFRILKGNERKLCLAVLLLKIGLLIPSFTSEIESSSYISYMNWFLSGLFIATIMQHSTQKVKPVL